MTINPIPTPIDMSDKFEMFAHLSDLFRRRTAHELTLVGGSAYEWHFPNTFVSLDLDIVIQAATNLPRRAFEEVLKDVGFGSQGKSWHLKNFPFSVEIVGSTLALAPKGVGADTETVHAPKTSRQLRLMTATMMWCDRMIAWEALPQSNRDERQSLLPLTKYRTKLDFARARQVFQAAGILGLLKKRMSQKPEWQVFVADLDDGGV